MEDTLFAGALVASLQEKYEISSDAAAAALRLYEGAREDIYGMLQNASHLKRLVSHGIKRDIKFCLLPNQMSLVPILKDGVFVPY